MVVNGIDIVKRRAKSLRYRLSVFATTGGCVDRCPQGLGVLVSHVLKDLLYKSAIVSEISVDNSINILVPTESSQAPNA